MPTSADKAKAAYFDTHTGKWETFDDVAACAFSPRGKSRRNSSRREEPEPFAIRPQYRDGKITYVSGYLRLMYFDGKGLAPLGPDRRWRNPPIFAW